MTQAQVRINFWESLKVIDSKLYNKANRSLRQNKQSTEIRIYFTEYIEHLYNDGDITEKQAIKYTL
jgi:hypothetical protein